MEPLKNMFSPVLLEGFTQSLQSVWPAFPSQRFLNAVFDDKWPALELKQRMRHISHQLRAHLPPDYPEALDIMVNTTQLYLERRGESMAFEYSFIPDFVEAHGVEHPDVSIPAMAVITRWCSAEFAVRPYLLRYPERMYAQMLAWSDHSSAMVRRLSSEGIRPRLPWGMGVPALKKDPSPVLPILEKLKNDPAETVRRSVANNLNDISKEHPALVLDIARRWLGQSAETDWVVRHACRGLLKRGNETALAHFGFEQGVEGISVDGLAVPERLSIGDVLEFTFALHNHSKNEQRLRIEYAIDYQTLSGKTSHKVFNIKAITLTAGASETIVRRQRFTDFTTRKHYPGLHRLYIVINGKRMTHCDFMLEA